MHASLCRVGNDGTLYTNVHRDYSHSKEYENTITEEMIVPIQIVPYSNTNSSSYHIIIVCWYLSSLVDSHVVSFRVSFLFLNWDMHTYLLCYWSLSSLSKSSRYSAWPYVLSLTL